MQYILFDKHTECTSGPITGIISAYFIRIYYILNVCNVNQINI